MAAGSDPAALASQLSTISSGDDYDWASVEQAAQDLANALRTKDGPVDNHTIVGKSSLPQALTKLVRASLDHDTKTPRSSTKSAVYELLRVGANVCMNHDENRQRLLDAEFPQTTLELLRGYLTSMTLNQFAPALIDLKVIKTAIGAILNVTMSFEPVRSNLIALDAPLIILQLSTALYPAGAWSLVPERTDDIVEAWNWRSGLSGWAQRAIQEFQFQEQAKESILGLESLSSLIAPLRSFVPPYPSPSGGLVGDMDLRNNLINADLEVLDESTSFLESLAFDVEAVRISLAQSITSGTPEESSLGQLLDFVEKADYPPFWSRDGEDEERTRRKALDLAKASVIKCIIAVAGEDKCLDTLWKEGDKDAPGGWFASRLVGWVRGFSKGSKRDDLAICGTLALGNLARKESICLALVNPPVSIVPDLAYLLKAKRDIKLKHGAVGLLKNLSQTAANRPTIGDAGVLEKLALSKIWDSSTDSVEVVQMSAIGIAKNLCTGNLENALRFVSDPATGPSALNQVLDLVRRSDTIAVKSEGTRIIGNAIKSLWSTAADSSDEVAQKRKEAIEKITTPQSTAALAQMIGRSKRYPILLNEGVVALTLLASTPTGGPRVLHALTFPLPAVVKPQQSLIQASPISTTPTALDMLILILNSSEPQIPLELKANVCSLLASVGKKAEGGGQEIVVLKTSVKDALTKVVESPESAANDKEKLFRGAAAKALEVWS